MALFRLCSSCRGEIACGALYWVCSVSTCTRKRTGLFFCSVSCWEAHLPSMRHRESWAVEKRAPSASEWEREKKDNPASAPAPKKTPAASAPRVASPAVVTRRAAEAPSASVPSVAEAELARDVLIVVSKLKKYIKARSGMNTSDTVMDPLSDCVREICDKAIRAAGTDGRRTVMDRDIKAVTS